MNDLIQALCGHLRAMQLLYHQMHHTAGGVGFFGDHETFKGFYIQVEEAFDSVVEWGLSHDIDCADPERHLKIAINLLNYSADELEDQLCQLVELVCKHKEATEGLKQRVGTIAEQSETRQYLTQQRFGK